MASFWMIAVIITTAFLMERRTRRRLRQLECLRSADQREVARLARANESQCKQLIELRARFERRWSSLERRQLQLAERVKRVGNEVLRLRERETSTQASAPISQLLPERAYQGAARRAALGANVVELVQDFGLSASEAELIAKVNARMQ